MGRRSTSCTTFDRLAAGLPLPRTVRRRAEAVDALDLIRQAVNRVAPDWPSPHSEPRARTDGDHVVVWFEGAPDHPEIRLTASF